MYTQSMALSLAHVEDEVGMSLGMQHRRLNTQISGYKELRAKLETAAAQFEEEKLTFDFQKVGA